MPLACRSFLVLTCRLVKDVLERMKTAGISDIPLVVGGIIPPEDAELLESGRCCCSLYAQRLPVE